ncbi:MAG: hypothetical protein U9R42_04395, partial [Bacteroidota bacterium]|nr:hypothetical protein [Bacteroidota bacterium]
SFRFFTENGVGADAEILINKIEAKNNKTKLNKILSSTILNNPIVVQRATDNPFTPKYSYVELNNSNSNAKELIEILPDEFEYDIEVRFNPNGNTSNYNDFVYHDSKVNAGVEIELPLFISAEGLTMLDTLDFSLADAKSLDNIEKAMFRIIASNTFPFDASLQLYFVDKNNDILDSLFMADNRIMPGEIQEPGNKVMLAKITRIPEIVGASKMDNISYAEKIIIKAVFNTIPKDRKLKIYSDYKLNVKLVADFTYKTSF